MQQGKRFQRPRKDVSHTTITVLSPFFRYSASRDAYVLRAVGNTHGPVLREHQPVGERFERK
jgi:hypothetical protein